MTFAHRLAIHALAVCGLDAPAIAQRTGWTICDVEAVLGWRA